MLYVWGLPYFPENDNQVFGAGYRFGGGCPFFQKLVSDWYWVPIWGGGVNTSGYTENRVGTQWVSILNWYPPPPPPLVKLGYVNEIKKVRNIAGTELKGENVVINLSELNLEIHGSEMKWLGDFKQSYVVEGK